MKFKILQVLFGQNSLTPFCSVIQKVILNQDVLFPIDLTFIVIISIFINIIIIIIIYMY